MRKAWAIAAVLAVISPDAFAAEADIGPLFLDSVAVIATATGGHLAGNMEIEVRGGFIRPPGVVCDTWRITTRKAIDPDRAMLSLLQTAKTFNRAVRLRITDSSAQRAFSGRCSLELVALQ